MAQRLQSVVHVLFADASLDVFAEAMRIRRNLSTLTIRAYMCDLRGVREWLSGRKRAVGQERRAQPILEQYLREIVLSKQYRDTTIRRKIATIRVFLKFNGRSRTGRIAQFDLQDFQYKTEERLPTVMTDSEFSGFLRTVYRSTEVSLRNGCRSDRFLALRDRVLFDLLFSTGVRIGEMSKAEIEDISLESRMILIRGKGRRQRLLELPHPKTIETLSMYLDDRKALDINTRALILNRRQSRMSIHSIGHLFQKYSKRAGLARHVTPHAVRHTVATGLLRNGADVRVVQVILGHTNILTTQRYTHVAGPLISRTLATFGPRNSVEV